MARHRRSDRNELKFDLRTLFHWTSAMAIAFALGFYAFGKPRSLAEGVTSSLLWAVLFWSGPAFVRWIWKMRPRNKDKLVREVVEEFHRERSKNRRSP